MLKLKVVVMRDKHLKECIKLYNNIVVDKFHRLQLKNKLEESLVSNKFKCKIALKENEVVALCVYANSTFDYACMQIDSIYVKSGFQKLGIGTLLINKILSSDLNNDTCILTTNVPEFFSSLGFKCFNTDRKNFFLMGKTLRDLNY